MPEVTRADYATAVLQKLGSQYPVNDNNLDALVAQQIAEGSQAVWNPMDTTEPWEGATDYNDVGVKNYASYDDGVAASVATLTNGDYGTILNALELGNSAQNVVNAAGWRTWGTESFDTVLADVQSNRANRYGELVSGSSASPAPVPQPAPAPPPVPEPTPEADVEVETVQQGSTGAVVGNVQALLVHHGATIAVDGDFGPITNGAVQRFQQSQGIGVDGIVGPVTWGKLVNV